MTNRIDIEPMAGRWLKTNDKPQWIGSADVKVDGDRLMVRLHGGGLGPTPRDWGTVPTEAVYASRIDTSDAHAGAFVCKYAFDDFDVEVQANLNLGLLVIATYVTFRKPGPHANRFTREFFRRDA
ncbi:MAG TPA: hypothetical protein VGF28_11750 [Thermoanaerobaculia bacterium]|jgi:hypothetical protein